MPKRSSDQPSNIGRRRDAAREGEKKHYVVRRQAIVRAAAQVFKERGLSRTTLTHIAEAMGADRASLYYYVSSKEDLFQEIVSEAVKVNLATATAIRDDDAPAPEKLRRLIEGLMVSYGEFYPVLYVLIQENLSHVSSEHGAWAEDMKRVNREYERVLIDIIEAGQADGTVRATAPAWLIAYGLIGMVGWTNRWFNPNESRVSAQEIGTAFADIVLLGLAPEPQASARSDNGGVKERARRPRRRA
jgi:TetR/AcrR family transcriptional regulator, cholesterol catabolism regulator